MSVVPEQSVLPNYYEMHHCSHLVVFCMDFRFKRAVDKWLSDQELDDDYDCVALAGSQKTIIDEETRAIALKQLKVSINLHHSTTVFLIAHQDCGAYGFSKSFISWQDEKYRYVEDLLEAEAIIKAQFPELKVEKFILTFFDNKIEITEVAD